MRNLIDWLYVVLVLVTLFGLVPITEHLIRIDKQIHEHHARMVQAGRM